MYKHLANNNRIIGISKFRSLFMTTVFFRENYSKGIQVSVNSKTLEYRFRGRDIYERKNCFRKVSKWEINAFLVLHKKCVLGQIEKKIF